MTRLAPEVVGQDRFADANDFPIPCRGFARDEVFEGSAKLLFRLSLHRCPRLGLDGLGKGLQAVVDQVARVHLALGLSPSSGFAVTGCWSASSWPRPRVLMISTLILSLQFRLPILSRPQDNPTTKGTPLKKN